MTRDSRDRPAFDPIDFVHTHGVVLASAKGPIPNLADAIAGEPIRGSWWGHARGSDIFHALGRLDDSPDVLCCRLVEGKITYVHRRLWPALVRLADELGRERLAAIRQEHTESGAHKNVTTPFPEWVTPDVARAASAMSNDDARRGLGSLASAKAPRRARRPRS